MEIMTLIKVKSRGTENVSGRKNLIINGAMQVAQRATTVGSLTSTNSYHTCDRYRFQLNDLGTWEISQSTESPEEEGFNSSLKLNCTTADTSVAAGSYLILQQRIEGQNVQHLKYGTSSAESLTFSFWIKSVKTGLVSLEFQHQNSGGTYYNRGATFTINTTNTWEKKIITVPGNTAQNIKDGSVDGLYASFWFTAGTNYTSGTHNTSAWATGGTANRVSSSGVNFADSTSNEIYITGVQLEVGDSASDFEHRSIGEELALCQRYFENIQVTAYFVTGNSYSTSQFNAAPMFFKTKKRSTPDITFPTLGNTSGTIGPTNATANYVTLGSVLRAYASPDWFQIYNNAGDGYSGFTDDGIMQIYSYGTTTITANSEL